MAEGIALGCRGALRLIFIVRLGLLHVDLSVKRVVEGWNRLKPSVFELLKCVVMLQKGESSSAAEVCGGDVLSRGDGVKAGLF